MKYPNKRTAEERVWLHITTVLEADTDWITEEVDEDEDPESFRRLSEAEKKVHEMIRRMSFRSRKRK